MSRGGLKFSISGHSQGAAARQSLLDLERMNAVKSIIKAGGAQLQSQTQRNMTQKYRGHYEGKKFVGVTGTTKRSVALTIEDGGKTARVTVGTSYFPYLEKGTRYMSARPTLKPAFDLTKGIMETKFSSLKGK